MVRPPSRYVCGRDRPHWSAAEIEGCPLGRIICAICPGAPPLSVVESFGAEEKAYADSIETSERRGEWIGGRLCLGHAISLISRVRPPMLPTVAGAPTVPAGVAGSVSHKGPLALAIAARTNGGLGVDVECASSHDAGIERKVLTRLERDRVAQQGDRDVWRYVLAHFSLKEAVYKALSPADQVDLEFDNVEVVLEALPEREWLTPETRLLTRAAVVRTALLMDGDWIISAAFRAPYGMSDN